VEYAPDAAKYPKPTFVLRSPYNNFAAILQGRLDPMTAMMTSKLKVQGSLGYMMRNVPTVLDFVRCCREITGEVL
jgi:putative sterol carrier protein